MLVLLCLLCCVVRALDVAAGGVAHRRIDRAGADTEQPLNDVAALRDSAEGDAVRGRSAQEELQWLNGGRVRASAAARQSPSPSVTGAAAASDIGEAHAPALYHFKNATVACDNGIAFSARGIQDCFCLAEHRSKWFGAACDRYLPPIDIPCSNEGGIRINSECR